MNSGFILTIFLFVIGAVSACESPNWSLFWSLELDSQKLSSAQKADSLAAQLAEEHGFFLLNDESTPAGIYRLEINESNTLENDKRRRERIDRLIDHPAVRTFSNIRRIYKLNGIEYNELQQRLSGGDFTKVSQYDEEAHVMWLLVLDDKTLGQNVTILDPIAERLVDEHNFKMVGSFEYITFHGHYLIMSNASTASSELASKLRAHSLVKKLEREPCYFPTRQELFFNYYTKLRHIRETTTPNITVFQRFHVMWLLTIKSEFFHNAPEMDEFARQLAYSHKMIFVGKLEPLIGRYRLKINETSACETLENEYNQRRMVNKLAAHPAVKELTREVRYFFDLSWLDDLYIPSQLPTNRQWLLIFNDQFYNSSSSPESTESNRALAEQLAYEHNLSVLDAIYDRWEDGLERPFGYDGGFLLDMNVTESSPEHAKRQLELLVKLKKHPDVFSLSLQNAIRRLTYADFKDLYKQPKMVPFPSWCWDNCNEKALIISGICCTDRYNCAQISWF